MLDKQTLADINFVCDLALKAGGIQALQAVNRIGGALAEKPKPEAPAELKKKDEPVKK